MVKKVWAWFVYSSADPAKIALTVRAGIPTAVFVAAWLGYGDVVTTELLDEGASQIVGVFAALGVAYGTVMSAYGFARKIYRLFVPKA